MNTHYFLTRLVIEGFRGVNNEGDPLDLSFNADAVNSIFAVNGIGKSSIFEALSYAIYGKIPKLDLLQAQEKPEEYYCNRFHSGKAASILLEFQPDDSSGVVSIQIDRAGDGSRTVASPSGHANPEEFLSNLKEAFALLDYRTFARFIEESSLKRGRTFSALLGLAEYSDGRQALQAVSETRTLNTDLEINVLGAAVEASQKSVEEALGILRSNYENVIGKHFLDVEKLDEYTIEITKSLGNIELLKSLFADKSLNDIDFDEVKSAIKTAEGGEKRQELEKSIETITTLEILAGRELAEIMGEQEVIGSLIKERDVLLTATRGKLFKRLYDSAHLIVSDESWTKENTCPLCESELSSSIQDHINGQLKQYSDAAAYSLNIRDSWITSEWKKFLSALETSKPLDVDTTDYQLPSLDHKFNSSAIAADDFSTAVEWTSTLHEKAKKILHDAKKRKEELEKELPKSLVQLTEQIEYGRQYKESLQRYTESRRDENYHQKRLNMREGWKEFISNAAKTFSKGEALLSKNRIQGIEVEYKSIYKNIMRVGDVVPDLIRANDREDLHVQLSNFHGQNNLSARALLSESYRNALAISVFLAAALKHSGVPRFIVLDDVTSSFDAGHQFFLMELIRTKLQRPRNAHGLQFIILSHDGLLEKYFDRLNSDSDWNHNKLQGSPPMGAIMHQAQGVDRLRATIMSLISSGQISQTEPLIRQYLEYKLQQIIRKVGIPVPIDFAIKDTSRMVSNCIDAITSAIYLHKQAGSLVLSTNQIQDLEATHVPAIVGNWVSHYETGSGSSLSANALTGIIDFIDDLAECFRYDNTSGSTTGRRWYRALDRV